MQKTVETKIIGIHFYLNCKQCVSYFTFGGSLNYTALQNLLDEISNMFSALNLNVSKYVCMIL